MTDDTEREDRLREINDALQHWRQGDCTVGDHWFVHRVDPRQPLTEAAQDADDTESDLIEVPVSGFVVLTQTCDIVRDCTRRPYVEIAPLVEIGDDMLDDIERARRPQYAYIRGVADRRLVADLDRVMTMEKSVLADWKRVPGCETDLQQRRLVEALKRKRSRFAFPDDFTELATKLQKRINNKHGRASVEGNALRALREIRVAAAPSWDTDAVELTFYFIRDSGQANFEGQNWQDLQQKWLALVPKRGRFISVNGTVVTFADLTAQDYLESDPLDLDHLSSAADGDV